MSGIPIRWRLTLRFLLILSLIMVVAGFVVLVLVQHYLLNEIDDNLRINSAKVHGTLNPVRIPDQVDFNVHHSELPPIAEMASPGLFLEFIDSSGGVIMKSQTLGDSTLPLNSSLIDDGLAGKVAVQTIVVDGDSNVRLMISPMYLNGQTLLLVAGESLDSYEMILNKVRLALISGALLALVLSGISAFFMIRQTLSPVQRITRTARNIEKKSDLTQRVPYNGPKDEIGQLALTFNQMLEHLNELFQSQKRFVADASHDIRIPLTVIKGNYDLLVRDPSRADRMDSLNAIGREATRIMTIADSLLTLARLESTNRMQVEPVPLHKLVREEYQRALQMAGGRSIHVEDQTQLYVMGDEFQLKQMISNLVDNALIYTSVNGTVSLSLTREDGHACLRVSDDGIGIAPEHLGHIFEPFYRSDKARSRVRGGTGLGLAIVKGIVEKHGGTVSVVTEPGQGSTFTVLLKL